MNKILQVWNWIEKFIVGLLAFLATTLAFYGVIARYILRKPLEWGEEVAIYMIIWAVFIIASTLAAERGHVAASLIVERFSFKTRRTLAILNGLLALGFCVLVGIFAYRIVILIYLIDERSLTSLRFPLWIPYLSVAAGCTLISLRYGIRIYRLLFQFDPEQILEIHEISRERPRS
ncbi:MAG: TRAP transporter small permease [Thermodesulfobacteriota bacterium]|nr:TRAP transporter small permease [Thermodesulfobacteriota bacterium]